MVVVETAVDGVLQWNGNTYKAQYNPDTGKLELSDYGGATTAPSPSPQPPEAPEEGKPQPAQGQGNAERNETTAPEDMASLKIAIERVLKQNRLTKLEHNRLKGKLDLKSKALTKSQAGSQSVRTKKNKAGALGYNIILLVDNSGSMAHGDGNISKITLANAVTKNLHAVLHHTDGTNVKVLAFTDELITIANWHDTAPSNMAAGGGNSDAAACYVTLTEQFVDAPNPEYRNILLVLSDGRPCDGRLGRRDLPKLDVFSTQNMDAIATFVARIAKQCGVYVAGLGIQYQSDQIPNSRKIDELKDVQAALVAVLKGAIDHG